MGRKLFFQKAVHLDANDVRYEALSPDIPFYGKKGTICRIEVSKDSEGNELCYHTVVYHEDGTIHPTKINTPRNKGKNLTLLLESYYKELKKYLEFHSHQYLDYKNTGLKKLFNKKKLQALIFLFGILTFAALGIFFQTMGLVSFLSAVTAGITGLVTGIQAKGYLEVIKDEKQQKTLHEYEELQRELIEYLSKREKMKNSKNRKQTIFTPIAIANGKSFDKEKYKVKLLVKEESKEAA